MQKLIKQAAATIPMPFGMFNMMAYATKKNEAMPHLALLHPKTDFSKPVPVRIHSECITGDLFGSRRCECGEQLHWSLAHIGRNGGLLIYLRQEGRGIGIINKLHAYTKQDEGYDTAEANKILGFGYDERTYEDAITILQSLDIEEINLLTNNPEKIASFSQSNVRIMNRIAVEIAPRKDNIGYLKTKKEFFGHFLKSI